MSQGLVMRKRKDYLYPIRGQKAGFYSGMDKDNISWNSDQEVLKMDKEGPAMYLPRHFLYYLATQVDISQHPLQLGVVI